MISLVIIDSQAEYRQTIERLLSSPGDVQIIGTGTDGYDALRLTETLKPDIMLLDINLSYLDGAKVTSIIKCRSPSISIIILTSIDNNDEYVLNTICNGASGYLLKSTDTERLADFVRTVYDGGSLLTPRIATRAFRMFSNLIRNNSFQETQKSVFPSNISGTELEIISFIGQGLSNREIAEKIKLREGTVRNRITLILQKTGLRDRTQIAIFAIHQGLIRAERVC
jgi:DNA-binding NarL/FixJ family response regulator